MLALSLNGREDEESTERYVDVVGGRRSAAVVTRCLTVANAVGCGWASASAFGCGRLAGPASMQVSSCWSSITRCEPVVGALSPLDGSEDPVGSFSSKFMFLWGCWLKTRVMRITGITVPNGVWPRHRNLLEFVSAFTGRDHNRLRNVSRLTSTEPPDPVRRPLRMRQCGGRLACSVGGKRAVGSNVKRGRCYRKRAGPGRIGAVAAAATGPSWADQGSRCRRALASIVGPGGGCSGWSARVVFETVGRSSRRRSAG